jgi:hypothetical protein
MPLLLLLMLCPALLGFQGTTLRHLGIALSVIGASIYACTSLWTEKNELCVSVWCSGTEGDLMGF